MDEIRPAHEDLSRLPARELEALIAGLCAPYGKVVRISIHPGEAHSGVRTFALVDMFDEHAAQKLANAFNRPRMGNAVILLVPTETAT